LKEGAAGCVAGHLGRAGHQPSCAVARALEEFSNVEVWPTKKKIYRQNN